jgi:chemotaxis protein MotB
LSDSTGVLEFTGLTEIKDLASFVRSLDTRGADIMIDYDEKEGASLPAFETLRKALGKNQKSDDLLEISHDTRGVSFSFHENVFFSSGRAAISAESYPLMEILAAAIADCANDILIMGHTDKTPIKKGRFNSNLELSVYRGMAVLRYFIDQKNLDPDRFAVGGYGSWRPLKPNNSRIADPANRRVEIIFKSTRET